LYVADSVSKAIKRCKPDRGNLLRNLANRINTAVETCTPESYKLLLELANQINMTVDATVVDSDDLLDIMRNRINTALKANVLERENILRKLAKDIEKAIEESERASAANQDDMKSLDDIYCDDTGEEMDLGLAGTFSRHRVFSGHLTTSNLQVAWVVSIFSRRQVGPDPLIQLELRDSALNSL